MYSHLLNATRSLLLIGLLTVAVGCDSGGDNDDDQEQLRGEWVGTTTLEGTTFTMSLQLTDNNGSVNANGLITWIDPVSVNGAGTFNFPNFSITLSSSGFADMNFSGTLGAGGNTLTGTLNASGFESFAITLTRR